MVAGRVRRAGAEVFPQARRAGAPEGRRARTPCRDWLWRQRRRRGGAAASCPRISARRRDHGHAGVRPPGRHLDLLGLEAAATSTPTTDARAYLRRDALHARAQQMARAELAAMVQHRPALGLRHRRPGPGPLLRRLPRPASWSPRPSAYEHPQPHACFIQSVADDLVNEGGIMDLWVREARLFKYGSGTGSNFSKLRGEGERLSGGGKSSGLMSFLKIGDRAAGAIKSGGTTRRAAKMVMRRHRPSRHRELHRLEGGRGAEGRRPRRRLQARRQAPQRRSCRPATATRRPHGEPLRSEAQQGARSSAIIGRAQGDDPRELRPARDRVRAPGLHRDRLPRSTTPTGIPTPTSPSPARTPTTRCASPTTSSQAVEDDGDWQLTRRTDGKVAQDAQGARAVGADRRRRLGLRRSRHPVRHHHQRVAHLPGERPHQRVQPVLRVHVPRRHGLQPRVAQPAAVPQRRTGTFDVAAFEHACRLWTIDARDHRADGAVPVAARSPGSPTTTARSASATPISAPC